jgi:hypothetical protein
MAHTISLAPPADAFADAAVQEEDTSDSPDYVHVRIQQR